MFGTCYLRATTSQCIYFEFKFLCDKDRVWCRTPDDVAESATYKALVKALRRGTEQLLIIIQASRTLLPSACDGQSVASIPSDLSERQTFRGLGSALLKALHTNIPASACQARPA